MASEAMRLLYKVPEAARLLGLGKTTVYELIRRNKIETVKIGGARRIPLRELERLARP